MFASQDMESMCLLHARAKETFIQPRKGRYPQTKKEPAHVQLGEYPGVRIVISITEYLARSLLKENGFRLACGLREYSPGKARRRE